MSIQKVHAEIQISSTELCNTCCERNKVEEGYFKCKLCNVQRKKSNGFSNLKDFIKKEKNNKKGPLNTFLHPFSKEAKNLHGWIEWLFMGYLPQLFVEDKYARKFAGLEYISRHILYKTIWIRLVTKYTCFKFYAFSYILGHP